MISIDVDVYDYLRNQYIKYDALIDTGADICAIAKHIAEEIGIPIKGEKVHLWQVRDPLTVEEAVLRIRYAGEV